MLEGALMIATPCCESNSQLVICCRHFLFAVGDTRGGADEPIEIESSSDEEVFA